MIAISRLIISIAMRIWYLKTLNINMLTGKGNYVLVVTKR